MKKTITAITLAALLCCTSPASAFKLSDLFGGDTGKTVGNLLEGVFSTSDISVADMAGQWTVDGSAVCFQSENFLSKAGGLAATAAIKSKLDPYYSQYGLTGAVFAIEPDGTFTLTMKRMTLHGIITKRQDGNFTFTFTALGSMKIGEMTTFVQKSPQTMDIMFDATKLKSLLQIASRFTGSKLASTAVTLLDSYEGICVGFGTTLTGKAPAQNTEQPAETGGSGLGDLLNGLFGGGQQQQQQQSTTPQQNATPQQTGGSNVGTLLDLLRNKGKK